VGRPREQQLTGNGGVALASSCDGWRWGPGPGVPVGGGERDLVVGWGRESAEGRAPRRARAPAATMVAAGFVLGTREAGAWFLGERSGE
jgi:hypothetical protein